MEFFQEIRFRCRGKQYHNRCAALVFLYGIKPWNAANGSVLHGNKKGMIDVLKPEIIYETPISAVLDSHGGMGQLIGAGMGSCHKESKAKRFGNRHRETRIITALQGITRKWRATRL